MATFVDAGSPSMRPIWKAKPDDHDYPAAEEYLSLCIASAKKVWEISSRLHDAPTATRKAKDILRASGLPILDKSDPYVKRDIEKVEDGAKLSPVLIVIDNDLSHPCVIADGYHRICASYHLDPNTDVPCKLVSA